MASSKLVSGADFSKAVGKIFRCFFCKMKVLPFLVTFLFGFSTGKLHGFLLSINKCNVITSSSCFLSRPNVSFVVFSLAKHKYKFAYSRGYVSGIFLVWTGHKKDACFLG